MRNSCSDVYLLEHKEDIGRDAVVEKIVNQRSKAHIHDVPPRWLSHFGATHEDMPDDEYAAMFTKQSLRTLAEDANAIPEGFGTANPLTTE